MELCLLFKLSRVDEGKDLKKSDIQDFFDREYAAYLVVYKDIIKEGKTTA